MVNDTYVANITGNTVPTSSLPLILSSVDVGATVLADWIFIKKYVEPEPSHGIWSPETVDGAPASNFEGEPRWGYDNATVYFISTSTGVINSYAWDFNEDTVTDCTCSTCNYTYTSPGTYSVSLETVNGVGSDTDIKPDYIYLMSYPTPTPTPTPCPTCRDALTETVDVGAAGAAGTLITMMYVVIFVGMFSGLYMVWNWIR